MHLNVTCALLRKGLAFVSKWKIYQKIIYGYHLKIYFVTNPTNVTNRKHTRLQRPCTFSTKNGLII